MDFNQITSLVPLVFSSIALFFTYRNGAHRISLYVTPDCGKWVDYIMVNNDSSFVIGILSVGYFNAKGEITWLPSIGSFVENRSVTFPIRIDARYLYSFQVLEKHIGSQKSPHGYCVQLVSGGIYICRHTAPSLVSLKLHFGAFISWLTAGRFSPWISKFRLSR